MQFASFPPAVHRFGGHLGETLTGPARVRAVYALTSATAAVLDELPRPTAARIADGHAPEQLSALVLDVATRAYRSEQSPVAELTPDDLAALAAIVA